MNTAKITSLVIVPNVIKASTGGFDVYWDIEMTGVFTPKFYLEIGPTELGPWAAVDNTPLYSLKGVGPKQLNNQVEYFFRIVIKNNDTGEVVSTSIGYTSEKSLSKRDRLLYREMVRREALTLDKFNGADFLLFRRIVNGTPCTDCVDEILQQPASNECPSCYGIGFLGGYYKKGILRINVNADDDSKLSQQASGPQELSLVSGNFPGYPIVKFKDIMVDPSTNKRYEIVSTIEDQFHTYNIRQTVIMSRLPPSDPSYQVPINV